MERRPAIDRPARAHSTGPAREDVAPVLAQLQTCGAWIYVLTAKVMTQSNQVRGTMRLTVLPFLRAKCVEPGATFKCGPFSTLHRDVGHALADFRSIAGAFGRDSLQIVIDQETGAFYADVDKFSAYQDAVNLLGHFFGELIPHWLKPHKQGPQEV